MTMHNSISSNNRFVLLPSAINASSANINNNSSHFSPSSSTPTTTLPEQLPLPIVLILSVPAMLIILLTVFGNLLVLFFKARVGRTNTTLLVWNLGLTDFMVGVLVLPMGAYYLLNRRWIFGHMLCRIWVGADVTFCTCSVVTICIISVDRYLAVTRPLRYKSVVTKLKVIVVIILIWTFSLGILLATVRWESQRQTMDNKTCYVGDEIRYLAHSVVFAFFLPASVTLTLYWRIYSLARNRQRALDRGFLMILGHNMNFLTNTLSQTTALRVHIGKNNGMVEHQRRVLRTHERIAKTLGVVSCSFLFCWLPFFTLYLLNHQCENCVPSLAIDIASWLGYCNSMLNPIIYSFTVKEFKRSAFRAVLPIWRCAHGWCPRMVRKPPDAKSTHRIARKRQQISATQQQQQQQVPAPIGADGRKRRIPSRERLSRARAGAIASLMVNTNCSIMQNAMTVELVNNNNNRRIKRGNDDDKSDDGDDGKGKEHQHQMLLNTSSQPTTMVLVNGLEEGARRTPNMSKRSMVMLGENLNKAAQKLATARRQSSLDELLDIRKYSDSGGELFSRSGLVTTTLLLATSESICGDGCCGHGHNSVVYSNSCGCCYSNRDQQQQQQNQQYGMVRCAAATTMTTTTGERTGSLPNSPSFSSSLDSDLTAEHSKHSVRMPCKFPVKKWKRRRHSMHGIPSTKNNAGNKMMPTPLAEMDNSTNQQEEERRKSNSSRTTKKRRKCEEGGGQQQQQQRRKKALFAAFKRVKHTAAAAENSGREAAAVAGRGGQQKQGEEAEGGEGGRSFSPTTATTTSNNNNVGLWQRARAMASRRHRHNLKGTLSGSNSLGSIERGGGGRKSNNSSNKSKEKQQRSKDRGSSSRTVRDTAAAAAASCSMTREAGEQQQKQHQQQGQKEKGSRITTTDTTITAEHNKTAVGLLDGGGESSSSRERAATAAGTSNGSSPPTIGRRGEERGETAVVVATTTASSSNRGEREGESGRMRTTSGEEETVTTKIFCVTDETAL